ncbi:MAG TPA: HYR domain-containing protein [Opitutaceae bacterium]|nr:HYR domain-containing protein [Opitutaceae bacterium]
MAFAVAACAATTTRASVVFSRTSQTAETWTYYTATFTAPYSGPYTLGFNLTAGGSPSTDNAILIDAVQISQGATTVFADGFETPALAFNASQSASGGTATIGNWACANYSGILRGSPPNWGLAAQGLGTADGTQQYGYLQAVFGTLGKMKATNTISLVAGQTYSVSFFQASRRDFGGNTTYTVTLDFALPTVFASGISGVTTWDPIFPASANPNWQAYGTPLQTAGPLPNDPNWVNPHPAFVFPPGSHPWEFIAPMNFAASWINAWSDLDSRGPSGQNWTKYSTTVTGQGSFVLQFLADNLSWIYVDGVLIGNQDDFWQTGSGRYSINLTGAGPHELVFIIFDGGGKAGGKFRLETTQSFQENNPGQPLPPPPDSTPPVITAPSTITQEATSASGAVVTFTATANDAVSGAVPVTATPSSGSTFAIGLSSVALRATDAAGNTANAGILVVVQDTTAPVITGVPANVVVEAASAVGATATFGSATATDAVGVTSLTYSAASGSTFALGTTPVIVTAKDRAGNTTTGSFTVTVEDTIAPAITVPANVTAEATSSNGATVTYANATATDAVGVTSLTYSAASGSTFAVGTTAVTVTARDRAGHATTESFTVTVRDTTAPAVTVPANITAEATSASGAAVVYSAATATDAVGVTSLTYSAASGSTFALGTTTVTVTARDRAGNTTTGSFTVTVEDTIAPALTLPANLTAEATSGSGAAVTYAAATATDAVGVTSLTYSAASGSVFPLGTTTVTVTARDAAGHITTGSFTIRVADTTAPVIASVTPSTATLWPPNHQMVAVTLNVGATDALGATGYHVTVTSSEPDDGLGDGDTANDIQITGNGTLNPTVNLRAERAGKGPGRIYTISVVAKDAAGNASAPRSTTVSVPKSQGQGR